MITLIFDLLFVIVRASRLYQGQTEEMNTRFSFQIHRTYLGDNNYPSENTDLCECLVLCAGNRVAKHERVKRRPFKVYKNNPGGRLNKKDGLTRYGDSHVKDKTS